MENEVKRYAVGVCNFVETTNTIKIVHAKDKIDACLLVMGDRPDVNFETVEEVIQYYYDGDILLTEPVEIS